MWEIAERRGASALVLASVQAAFLQTIYSEFQQNNAWPTMYRVDRALMKARSRRPARTAVILDGLPEGLLLWSKDRPAPMPQDEVKLTISGVVQCPDAANDVESFVRAVRWCAKQESIREPEPGETSVEVTQSQVKRAIPAALRSDPRSMDRLFALLALHHWGIVQSSRPADGSDWTIRLGPEVARFKKVRTVEDFIDALVSRHEEGDRRALRGNVVPVATETTPPARTYIKPQVLNQLRDLRVAGWDTTKLVSLAQELDVCVQAGQVYASHMVLRALLDHVPPLFGQRSFLAVVSSHGWGQTDGRYMNRLRAFRDQADDALHRQISRLPDPLMHDDLPPATAVNALLRGCLSQLHGP